MSDIEQRLRQASAPIVAADVDPIPLPSLLRRGRAVRASAVISFLLVLTAVAVAVVPLGGKSRSTVVSVAGESPSLPRLGTFRYDVAIARQSKVPKVDASGATTGSTVISEKDSYTETLRNERAGSDTVRQYNTAPTGPGGWTEFGSIAGSLHEVATGSERVSPCRWDPPVLLVPAAPVEDGATWSTTSTCTYAFTGVASSDTPRHRVVNSKLIGRGTFSLGGESYEGLRLEQRVEEPSQGTTYTLTTISLFIPDLMMFAEVDTTFDYQAPNATATNRVIKRLTGFDLDS